MIHRCEVCGWPEPNRDLIFGLSCRACGSGGGVHFVHEDCARRVGIWAPWYEPWGVVACPDAARVAGLLMGEDES